jgi:F-type H+-transporting ATPase subunit c
MPVDYLGGSGRRDHRRAHCIRRQQEIDMTGINLLPIAVGMLIGIPALGSCIGIGLATMKLLEACARQPELIPALRTQYFLGVGVTDGAFIIASGIGLWLTTASPFK